MKKLSKFFVAPLLLAPLAIGCVVTSDDDDDTGNATENGTGNMDADTGNMENADTGNMENADTGNMDDPTGNVDDPTGNMDDPTGNMDDPTGGTEFMFCQHECTMDEDCTSQGTDIGFTCSTNSNRCISACTADIECQAPVNVGSMECTANADCEASFGVCVEYGDTDYCVLAESKMFPCMEGISVSTEVMDAEGGMVTICAAEQACEADDNGDMICVFTGEIPDPPEVTCEELACPEPLTCDDAAPSCVCASNQDCVDAERGNECVEGVCLDTCAADADCRGQMSSFDGGTFTCQ